MSKRKTLEEASGYAARVVSAMLEAWRCLDSLDQSEKSRQLFVRRLREIEANNEAMEKPFQQSKNLIAQAFAAGQTLELVGEHYGSAHEAIQEVAFIASDIAMSVAVVAHPGSYPLGVEYKLHRLADFDDEELLANLDLVSRNFKFSMPSESEVNRLSVMRQAELSKAIAIEDGAVPQQDPLLTLFDLRSNTHTKRDIAREWIRNRPKDKYNTESKVMKRIDYLRQRRNSPE